MTGLVACATANNDVLGFESVTDEEFANFRKIETTGIDNIYRSSNPVNAEIARNTYADNAFKEESGRC